MIEASLKSEIWIKALLRVCDLRMLRAYVLARGDPDAGAVLIKLNKLDGTAQVFSQTRGIDGERCWLSTTGAAPVEEAYADTQIHRQIGSDPDLWVIEIEDPNNEYEFDDPLI